MLLIGQHGLAVIEMSPPVDLVSIWHHLTAFWHFHVESVLGNFTYVDEIILEMKEFLKAEAGP